MNECYLCGVTKDKAVLYEGIYKSRGIIHVCRKCYFKEKIPLVDKKDIKIERKNSHESVRERLSRMAHVDVPRHEEKKMTFNQEDVHLKDIIEKNFKRELDSSTRAPEDLIDNFNWVIMRKRRSLKISKEKVAEDLFEPLIAIESLEKGILPRDYKSIIKKIENYLRINLRKNKEEIDHKDIINESRIPSGILVSDLKKKSEEKREDYIDASNLDLERINEIYGTPAENSKKENSDKKTKTDLDDEDISKLIWGK
ncbi:hypothetical protein GW931_01150 [archaeon]|nr:hypothetical protein [archaeon]PJC45508.1 MAG: hypothetical protein CO037_01130 [Candidatus Pacearchaeota archaeon CG_4_9_14_0_2_um_filter_30_8]